MDKPVSYKHAYSQRVVMTVNIEPLKRLKVVPYTFVRRGVPVIEDTYLVCWYYKTLPQQEKAATFF